MSTEDGHCNSYMALGFGAHMECMREPSHGGMHYWSGVTMSMDGTERDVAVSWSDSRKMEPGE